jgi:uncharacterized protein YjdB
MKNYCYSYIDRYKEDLIVFFATLLIIFCVVFLGVFFTAKAATVGVSYRCHFHHQGWTSWVSDGNQCSPTGKVWQMDGIQIRLNNATGDLSVRYRAYVQSVGWQNWVTGTQDGVTAGTTGPLQMQAIQIQLTGTYSGLDVKYQTLVQNTGWQAVVSDGMTSGTANSSLWAEDIKINVASMPPVSSYSLVLTAGTGGSVSGGGTYTAGSLKTITANPNAGYSFSSWSGSSGCGGAISHLISIDSDKSCEASFVPTFISPPTAPAISVTSTSTTSKWSWPVATCATGYSARYQYRYSISPLGFVSSPEWNTTSGESVSFTTATANQTYIVAVQAQCYNKVSASSWSDNVPVSYYREAVTQGKTYNVMNYGAKGDGVTDDAPAIHKAFDAADAANGGTVLLPSGHTYLIASGWNMPAVKTNDWLGQTKPTVHRSGMITVSGYGATIKYAKNIGRISWMQSGYSPSIWTTFGDLVIEGVTIDNNFAESPGELGRILWLHDANVENVTVRGVTMKNVSSRTAYNSPDSLCGVFIKENFSTPNPGHRAFERNITITDSTIAAQEKPIFIGSDGYGEKTYGYGNSPMVVDNIDIERVHTDNTGHIGTGIHLGSYASGGTAKVIDSSATNSSDNLIEIDAFNDVTVQNVKLSKAQSGIGFTWFSFPYLSTTPTYRIYNVTYSGGNSPYWPLTTTTQPAARRNSEGSVFLGAVSGSGGANLLSRSWGNMIMKGADLTNGEVNAFGIAQPPVKYGGAFASVDIEDVNITNIDSQKVGGPLLYVKQIGSTKLPLTLRNINYRTSTNGSFQPLPDSLMSLIGPYARL